MAQNDKRITREEQNPQTSQRITHLETDTEVISEDLWGRAKCPLRFRFSKRQSIGPVCRRKRFLWCHVSIVYGIRVKFQRGLRLGNFNITGERIKA